MVHAKNYKTKSTFVEVMQTKTCGLFFLDTVYNTNCSNIRIKHLKLATSKTTLLEMSHY